MGIPGTEEGLKRLYRRGRIRIGLHIDICISTILSTRNNNTNITILTNCQQPPFYFIRALL